ARHPPPAPPSRSSPGARPGRRACRRSPERPAPASSSGPADPRAAALRRRRRAAVWRRRAVRRRRRVPSLASSVGGGRGVRVCILPCGTYVVTPPPQHTTAGARAMMRCARILIAASIPLACAAADDRGGDAAGRADPGAVRPGVEVFVENPPEVVRGKRVGLITNHSGMDRQRRATIDLLRAMPELELVALFSPEHGIRGVAESRVESGVDEATGLPVHSLYSDTRKPTPEMLE